MKNYRYACKDNGFTYVYFFSPLCEWIVEKLPETLAPNTITMVGFMFSFLPCVYIFAEYGTSFKNDPERPIPSSFYLAQAFSYFMYRLFDETDGK